jgi:hypothetical protein
MIISPIHDPTAVRGRSMDSMCRRFIQHEVSQSVNATGRSSIAG